ncbi:MAG: multidrug efflux transporter transcriptional repressor AcrS [Calditrichia bacterium]
MRRTREEAEATRRKLMEVGLRVFHEKGYAATRLADVALAAGVTRGAIYHHFGSKLELFKAIALEKHNRIKRLMEEGIAAHSDNLLSAISTVTKKVFYELENNQNFRNFMDLLLKENLKVAEPELGAIMEEIKCDNELSIRQFIANAQEQGVVRRDISAELIEFFINAGFMGMMKMRLDREVEINLYENADALVRLIMSAVKA